MKLFRNVDTDFESFPKASLEQIGVIFDKIQFFSEANQFGMPGGKHIALNACELTQKLYGQTLVAVDQTFKGG